ncbi:condensation domain-containing protein, partial [Pseudoalteromonas luteoviolacea]|uniref:condensation domain-containing protein n=1 Tax=Pseudoalteromonas luteoviolacea TaxID=43657 RepID=UPI001F27AF34
MKLELLFDKCLEHTVSLSLGTEGELVVTSAEGKVPTDLIHELKNNKKRIVDWLKKYNAKNIVKRTNNDALLPLSFSQQRLWFINQFQGESTQYNSSLNFIYEGKFDIVCAKKALTEIVQRHEVLRTVYLTCEGEGHQLVNPPSDINISERDIQAYSGIDQQTRLEQLVDEFANQVFDLRNDVMLRCCHILLGEEKGALLFNVHHIASDGWSMEILTKEFVALYQGFVADKPINLAPLPVQYCDYAIWQREWLQGDTLTSQLDYWRMQLDALPAKHGLRIDKPRPPVKGHDGRRIVGHISDEVVQGLKQLASRHQLTPFMLLHAALSLVLARHSNRNDIVIGTPVANRLQPEVESLIGFFVNTLVLRVDTSFTTLEKYLRHVREVNLGAQSHQDVPFEQLVDLLKIQRNASHTPLFQIMLTMQSDFQVAQNQNAPLTLLDMSLSPLSGNQVTALFDLEINVQLDSDGGQISWTWDNALFEEASVLQLNDHLCRLLTQLSQLKKDPFISQLNILSEEERYPLLNTLNNTATQDLPKIGIHRLFEQCAEQNSDAVALVHNDKKLTYAMLNKR